MSPIPSRPAWFPVDSGDSSKPLPFGWPSAPCCANTFGSDWSDTLVPVEADYSEVVRLAKAGFRLDFSYDYHFDVDVHSVERYRKVVTNNLGAGKAVIEVERLVDVAIEAGNLTGTADFYVPIFGTERFWAIPNARNDFSSANSGSNGAIWTPSWDTDDDFDTGLIKLDETFTPTLISVCSGSGDFTSGTTGTGDVEVSYSHSATCKSVFAICKDVAGEQYKMGFLLYGIWSASNANALVKGGSVPFYIYTGEWSEDAYLWAGGTFATAPSVYDGDSDYSVQSEEVIGTLFGVDIKCRRYHYSHDFTASRSPGADPTCANTVGTATSPTDLSTSGTTENWAENIFFVATPN